MWPTGRMVEIEREAVFQRVMQQFRKPHGALTWMNSSAWRFRFFRARSSVWSPCGLRGGGATGSNPGRDVMRAAMEPFRDQDKAGRHQCALHDRKTGYRRVRTARLGTGNSRAGYRTRRGTTWLGRGHSSGLGSPPMAIASRTEKSDLFVCFRGRNAAALVLPPSLSKCGIPKTCKRSFRR